MNKLKIEIIQEVTDCKDLETLRQIRGLLAGPAPSSKEHPNRWAKYEGFGEVHSNAEWAHLLGIPRNTLWRNLQKGRTVEQVAKMRGITYPPAAK